MKIVIHASKLGLTGQGRAYVEYRMFSAISGFALEGAHLSVHLEEDDQARYGAPFICAVVLELASAGQIRFRTRAERLYGAVDAAAERLARGVRQRLVAEN